MMLKIRTLSPVNISTGLKYGPCEFIRKHNKINRINLTEMFKKLDINQVKTLSEGLEDRYFSLTDFFNKENITSTAIKYSINCETNIKRITEIQEQINTNNIPYIPGSSIKGAIRTAILWKYVKDNPEIYLSLEKEIKIQLENSKRFRNSRNIKQNIINDSIDNVFGLINNYKHDAKYDIFKFIEISDFMPDEESKNLELKEIKTYSLQRNGGLKSKSYTVFAETIKGEFNGTININTQIKYAVNDTKNYALLLNKLEMFGLDKTDLDNLKNAEIKMIIYIQKCLSEFNEWAIEKEIDLCKNENDMIKIINEIKGKNTIRLGFGIGTTYQTIIKIIEEKNKELFYEIIDLLELHGWKQKKSYLYGDNLKKIPYPKSIEFTSEGKSLGWLEWQS